MSKHSDDEPVMFGHDSNRNISFNNKHSRDESGYTWGEWRALSQKERDDALNEYLWEIAEVFVVDEE